MSKLNGHRKGYKKTKLGWIPEDWEVLTFKDVFEFIPTSSHSKSQITYGDSNNDIFNIHYGAIHTTYNETILDFNKYKIPKLTDEAKLPNSNYFLKTGDLVIVDASEDVEGIGKSVELKNTNGSKVIGGLHTYAARDKIGKTVEGFRGFIFKNSKVRKILISFANCGKIYGINKTELAKVPIILPTNAEQQKIGELSVIWDKAIENLEQLIATKETHKKGLQQQLFNQTLRFKDENGNDYPDWEEKRLGELCYIKAGGDVGKLNFSKLKTEEHVFPVYANALTKDGLHGYSDSYEVKEESVTVTGRGDVGFAIARKPKYTAVVRLLVLTPKVKTSNYFLKTSINQVRIFVESTGVPQLTSPQLSIYKVTLPCYEEQNKIAHVLSTADKEIENLKAQLEQLKLQKQGLMQKLLTGEVRVKLD